MHSYIHLGVYMSTKENVRNGGHLKSHTLPKTEVRLKGQMAEAKSWSWLVIDLR